ncbi:HlyD family efflux transporter periplasmic adaptor subunit [Lyngbya aestuarii]|uniref:HlyD family efflux transporter periplasmic adaptor subunit n=1 Tax=Lyngbya aestuarii TaxID=118322 RepID=UPI00403DE52D
MVHKDSQPLPKGTLAKPIVQWVAASAAVMALASGGLFIYSFIRDRPTNFSSVGSTTQEVAPVVRNVASLGRIEPEGGITDISAPAPNSGDGAVVKKILVSKGDRVSAGQVIAILDNQAQRQAILEQAKSEVTVAKANLDRVKAGAKSGDINAQKASISNLEAELTGQIASQKATIARIKAELRNAEVDFNRYEYLQKQGAISASELDSRRLKVDTTKEQLREANAALDRTIETLQERQLQARATLDSIAEVRPVDVQVAQAEVDKASAAVKQAEANLDLSYIRAPMDGQIIEVSSKAGEIQDVDGIARIAKIANTDQMNVIAEVYQTDIEKVRIGQEAIITSEAFPVELQGKVAEIGLQVNKQEIFSTNPMANTDNKIVKVKIRLDPEASKQVAALTNLQVEVVIVTPPQKEPSIS